ncbi:MULTISPECIES: c-type cytochrome [unclassified Bradyrhizobium]
MACHQIGPSAQNGIAPVLNGIVGRSAGQYPNYSYSSANKNSGLVWDERTLGGRAWYQDDLFRADESSGNIRRDRLPKAICRRR